MCHRTNLRRRIVITLSLISKFCIKSFKIVAVIPYLNPNTLKRTRILSKNSHLFLIEARKREIGYMASNFEIKIFQIIRRNNSIDKGS